MIIAGVDIGQSIDPTAIVLLERYTAPAQKAGELPARHFYIRHIERVALDTAYTAVVETIAHVAEVATAAMGSSCTTVVDATGVGRPVVDMLRRRLRLPLRAVTFTAAIDEVSPDPMHLRVPKRDLVQALEVALQGRRLKAVPGLAFVDQLNDELRHFEVRLTNGGRDSYEARSGHHDDLVMALALAVWYDSRRGQGSAFLEAWRSRAERRRGEFPAERVEANG